MRNGGDRRFRQGGAARSANADIHNYLGFAYRKSGALDNAFRHYGKALALNPRHRGAHEYIGETYLLTGDIAKAREHLGELEKICPIPCEELEDLKREIAAYETRAAPKSPRTK